MKKFSLDPNPTFRFPVPVPVPGEKVADVVFVFRHKTKRDLNDLIERSKKDMSDIDLVMEIACGWDLEDPFNVDTVTQMLENYHGAAIAISNTYVRELTGRREKN